MANDPSQYNSAQAALQNQLASSAPPSPSVGGGGLFGTNIFRDLQIGLSKNVTGWAASTIMTGGLAGIAGSAQRAPNFIARILGGIRDDFFNMTKSDPGAGAIMGNANPTSSDGSTGGGGGSSGTTDFASVASNLGLPSIVSGGLPAVMPDAGLPRPTSRAGKAMFGDDEGFGIG